AFHRRRSDEEWILAVVSPVLRIATTSLDVSDLPQPPHYPRLAKARDTLLAGEEFLHGALLELALLGEELLQGFDEGIRIAQRLGDGLLLCSGRRQRDG